MSPEHVLDQLEALASALDIEVRYTALQSDGGLCRVGRRRVLMVNRRLPVLERIDLLARTLPLDELDNVFIPPAVRRVIEGAQGAEQ